MENNNSFYFSIFGGYIYEANIDEEKTLDPFQIPLIEKPKPSCNKCNGRFYIEYNLKQKHFIICPKCSKKYINVEKILKKKNENRK
jgi:hypothetical protein